MQRVTIPDPSGALAAASAPTPLIVTGPRDTASHRHPASPSLAPTRRLSSPFRGACSQRPPPPITAEQNTVGKEAGGYLTLLPDSLHPPPSAPHAGSRPCSQQAPLWRRLQPQQPRASTTYSLLDSARLKPRQKGVRAFRAGAPLTRPALATSARTGGGGGDTKPAGASSDPRKTQPPRGPETHQV